MSSHQTYREVNPRLTTTSSDQGTSSMLPPQEQVTSYQASASALQGRQTASLFHELELSQRCVQAQSVQIEILKGQVQASQAQVTRLHSQLLMANRVSSENFQASEHHKSQSYQLSFELAASEERNLGQLKEIMMLKEQLHTTREIPRASSEASQPILSLEQTQSAAKQVATHQPSSPPSNNQWAKLSQWAEKKLPNVSVNTANNVKSAIEGGLSQLKNPLESQGPLVAKLLSSLTPCSSKFKTEDGSKYEERSQCTGRGGKETDIQITPQSEVRFVHALSVIFECFIEGGGQAASVCQAFKASDTNHQSIRCQTFRWNTHKVTQDVKGREYLPNAPSHSD